MVRPAVLIRAPARGGAVRRLGKAQHARLTDLGAILGHRGEHHLVAAATHRLYRELARLWSAWWAVVITTG